MSENTSAGQIVPLCRWCGSLHGPQCPTVKAIEFHQNGAVKRVEFKTAADFLPFHGGTIQPWLVGDFPSGPVVS